MISCLMLEKKKEKHSWRFVIETKTSPGLLVVFKSVKIKCKVKKTRNPVERGKSDHNREEIRAEIKLKVKRKQTKSNEDQVLDDRHFTQRSLPCRRQRRSIPPYFFSITIFRSKKKEEKLDDLSTGCLLLLVYDGAVWSHRQLRQFAAVVSLGTASRIGGRKCGT